MSRMPKGLVPVVVMVNPAALKIWERRFHECIVNATGSGYAATRAEQVGIGLRMQIIHNLRTRGRCQVCGCTEYGACPGGCAWANAEHNLCTKCLSELIDLKIFVPGYPLYERSNRSDTSSRALKSRLEQNLNRIHSAAKGASS